MWWHKAKKETDGKCKKEKLESSPPTPYAYHNYLSKAKAPYNIRAREFHGKGRVWAHENLPLLSPTACDFGPSLQPKVALEGAAVDRLSNIASRPRLFKRWIALCTG